MAVQTLLSGHEAPTTVQCTVRSLATRMRRIALTSPIIIMAPCPVGVELFDTGMRVT